MQFGGGGMSIEGVGEIGGMGCREIDCGRWEG